MVRPLGNSVGYTYDSRDRLTKVEQPTSANRTLTTTYGYDAAGNLTRSTDGRGNSTTYTYTPWDLLEDVVEPATSRQSRLADRTFTTTYDAAGQPVRDVRREVWQSTGPSTPLDVWCGRRAAVAGPRARTARWGTTSSGTSPARATRPAP